MKALPIIFSAPMVRALLDGRKTMTRRLAWAPKKHVSFADLSSEEQEASDVRGCRVERRTDGRVHIDFPSSWQRVQPGDLLWVRENLCRRQGEFLGIKQNVIEARYEADEAEVLDPNGFNLLPWWKGDGGLTSMYMPRRVSRLTLRVKVKKIERLQAISDEDAIAEGFGRPFVTLPDPEDGQQQDWPAFLPPRECFAHLWKKLHGPDAWDANPEVVAISFDVIRANVDAVAKEPA